MYIFGYIFYLRNVKDPEIPPTDFKSYLISIFVFLIYSSPILISLLGVIVFKVPFYISLVAGILVSIGINMYDKRKNQQYDLKENIFRTLYKGIKPSMIIAVIGIMIYKNVVNDMDELYVQLNSLLDKGIPLEIIILIAASMISLSMTSIQPSIAVLFPMILPLAADYDTRVIYAMFIYSSAFLFYYISPLHLCQVLTLEYFNVKIKDLYKNYLFILPLTFLVMVAIYAIKLM